MLCRLEIRLKDGNMRKTVSLDLLPVMDHLFTLECWQTSEIGFLHLQVNRVEWLLTSTIGAFPVIHLESISGTPSPSAIVALFASGWKPVPTEEDYQPGSF